MLRGHEFLWQVGKFAFVANSRARSVDDTEGMVKFIADKKTDKILGVHIMGPNAGLHRLPVASVFCSSLSICARDVLDYPIARLSGIHL